MTEPTSTPSPASSSPLPKPPTAPRQWLLAAVAGIALVAAAVDQANTHQHLVMTAAAAAIALTGLLFALAGNLDHGRLPLGPLSLSLLAFWGWGVAAIAWSTVPYLTALQAISFTTLLLSYLAWRIATAAEDKRIAAQLYILLIAAGLIMTLGMIGQAVAGESAVGLFLNPNSAAALVNVLWPLAAIAWLIGAERLLRAPLLQPLLPAALLLMAFVVGLEGGRATFLAAMTALLIILSGAATLLRINTGRLLGVAGLFLAGLALAYLVNALGLTEGRLLADRVASLANPQQAGGVRWLIWQATGEMIREAPWLGIGPGVFWLAYTAVRPPEDTTAGMFAHNDYLHFWVERGLPGLLIVVALMIAALWLFIRVVQAARSAKLAAEPTAVALAAFAATAGLALHGLFSYQLQLPALLIPAFLLLAELERLSPQPPLVSLALPRWRRPLMAVTGVAGLIAIGLCLTVVGATQQLTERGNAYLHDDDYAAAEQAFEDAQRLWGWIDVPFVRQAELYRRMLSAIPAEQTELRQRLLDQAIAKLAAASARNPLRPQTLAIRAKLRHAHPELTEGEPRAAFEQALDLDPRAVAIRTAYARYLWETEGPQAAREVVEEGVRLRYGGRQSPFKLYRLAAELRSATGDQAAAAEMRERLEKGFKVEMILEDMKQQLNAPDRASRTPRASQTATRTSTSRTSS